MKKSIAAGLDKESKSAKLSMQAVFSVLLKGRPLSAIEEQGTLMRVSGLQAYIGKHWSRHTAHEMGSDVHRTRDGI
jgi:hypothetical protein